MGCLSSAAWLPRWGLSITCLSRQTFTRRCSVAHHRGTDPDTSAETLELFFPLTLATTLEADSLALPEVIAIAKRHAPVLDHKVGAAHLHTGAQLGYHAGAQSLKAPLGGALGLGKRGLSYTESPCCFLLAQTGAVAGLLGSLGQFRCGQQMAVFEYIHDHGSSR